MPNLRYLVEEICCGVEIYYSGRYGQQYYNTAYILCDDYTELAGKQFLLTDDPAWTDKKPNGSFKNYHAVKADLEAVLQAKRPADLPAVQALHERMKTRRTRRNEFFHSTSLLDLNLGHRNVVEALCDLVDYGRMLFGPDWDAAASATRQMSTLEALLRVESRSFTDQTAMHAMNGLLQEWPINRTTKSKKGVAITVFPEDFHLRLCVTYGGKGLRDELDKILNS